MKKFYSLLVLPLLLTACYTQSGKVKVQSKVASYEAEKTLDDIKWYDGEPEGVQLIQISIPQNIINQYPELQDKRVGFGVTQRIIEVLEEVVNRMVKEWERSVNGLLDKELDSVGQFAQTKYFVYAELYDFAVSKEEEIKRRKAKISNKTMVGIQVRLVNVENGRYITGSGLGTSTQEGEGFLKNLDMSFDQSTVSFATTGAVITAVANVLRRMEKRGW